jgi:hypothetical protein
MLFSLFLCAALAGEPKWGFKIFEGLDHVYAMSSDGNVSSSAAYFANRAKSVSDTAGYELLSARNRLTDMVHSVSTPFAGTLIMSRFLLGNSTALPPVIVPLPRQLGTICNVLHMAWDDIFSVIALLIRYNSGNSSYFATLMMDQMDSQFPVADFAFVNTSLIINDYQLDYATYFYNNGVFYVAINNNQIPKMTTITSISGETFKQMTLSECSPLIDGGFPEFVSFSVNGTSIHAIAEFLAYKFNPRRLFALTINGTACSADELKFIAAPDRGAVISHEKIVWFGGSVDDIYWSFNWTSSAYQNHPVAYGIFKFLI